MILNTKKDNLSETRVYINSGYETRLCEFIKGNEENIQVRLILNKDNTKFEYFSYGKHNDVYPIGNISDDELKEDIKKIFKDKSDVSSNDIYKIARGKGIFYDDIPQISTANYMVNIGLEELPIIVNNRIKGYNLNLSPEYQRGYVWTEEQKIKYIEYFLRGGKSGRDIFLNCPGWRRNPEKKMEVVDGKQRLTALLEYLDNKFPAFGHYHKEYSGFMQCSPLNVYVNDLSDPKEIVQWYIDMNTGGSIHTYEDLKSAYDFKESLNSNK